ncbi:MAG TPA: HAD family hydrolase [Candidatus Baltobacteraceae bacterium]|nr:HAD family hydrolase [Candidatus Baltobacteraceae bacterium]
MLRAVGFDFDHTLGIDNKLERVAFLRILEEACASGACYLGTLAEEIERIDAILQRQRTGECSIEAAVEGFIAQRGVRPAGYADRYKRLALEMADAFVIPEPGVRALLDGLFERGIRCAILTNGWSPLQERKAQRVGFDGPVLVSATIGVQKPHRRAFELLAEALECDANDAAYVGDNPIVDVAGARAAGMRAVWYDAEGATYPKDIPAPDAVIHSLADICALT